VSRFLCVGDLHLGAGTEYGTHAAPRLRDQELVWEQVLGLAVDHDVDAVLFAGDAFHRRRPTPAELLAFQRPLQAFIAEHEIDVLAINGNHDVESGALPSALEIFGREVDLHVEPGLWHSAGGANIATPGGVTVATLPWTPVARLVASRNGGDRDESHDLGAQLLAATARELRAKIDGPSVLMLHWSVTDASTPTGVMTDEFREIVIELADLEDSGFDAIVMGHIHKAQILAPTIFYTGSPAPVDFGEANVEHGVWLLDVAEEGVDECTFLPVDSRPFVTVDVDVTAAETPPQAHNLVVEALEAADLHGAVVRIRYRATEEQARAVDHDVLAHIVKEEGGHKLYAIQPTIERATRARVEGVDEEIAPLAAVAAWCDANDVDEAVARGLETLSIGYLELVGP
jgi:exonuclease SbcD